MEMENILVYYVDEEPPTFTMKNLSGGIIAVIVVVVLAVVAGLLALVSAFNYLVYSTDFSLTCTSLNVSPNFLFCVCVVLLQKERESEIQQSPGEMNSVIFQSVTFCTMECVLTTCFLLFSAKRDGEHVKTSSQQESMKSQLVHHLLDFFAVGVCHFYHFT